MKIFGSKNIGDWLKLHFMQSLIMSRLMYCIHVLTMTTRSIAKLNAVHTRVLRRITGNMRFDSTCEFSDRQVREQCSAPSIDCLLTRARLLYIRRVCRHSSQALYLLLCMRIRGKVIPWIAQLQSDFGILHRSARARGYVIPDTSEGLTAWSKLFDDSYKWDELVKGIFFTASCTDKQAAPEIDESTLTFVCVQCPANPDGTNPAWSTSKALEAHCRTKHKVLCQWRYYADEKGICPICKTDFKSRIRCLAHLSDRRRTKSSDKILESGVSKLSQAIVDKLDLADRTFRREAHQSGHTHPIAQKPATRHNGRVVGRVCA